MGPCVTLSRARRGRALTLQIDRWGADCFHVDQFVFLLRLLLRAWVVGRAMRREDAHRISALPTMYISFSDRTIPEQPIMGFVSKVHIQLRWLELLNPTSNLAQPSFTVKQHRHAPLAAMGTVERSNFNRVVRSSAANYLVVQMAVATR